MNEEVIETTESEDIVRAEQGDQPEPGSPDTPESLAALIKERDDLKDQLLRNRAEFDNYRKRMLRENDQIRKTAARNLIEDLLPVLDNLERALGHAADVSADPVLQGVDMVVRSLHEKLSGHGLSPIAALGQPFDPNVHEALAHEPSEEHPADTVVAEYHRGYKLGDLVLRPAKVSVSSGPKTDEKE